MSRIIFSLFIHDWRPSWLCTTFSIFMKWVGKWPFCRGICFPFCRGTFKGVHETTILSVQTLAGLPWTWEHHGTIVECPVARGKAFHSTLDGVFGRGFTAIWPAMAGASWWDIGTEATEIVAWQHVSKKCLESRKRIVRTDPEPIS